RQQEGDHAGEQAERSPRALRYELLRRRDDPRSPGRIRRRMLQSEIARYDCHLALGPFETHAGLETSCHLEPPVPTVRPRGVEGHAGPDVCAEHSPVERRAEHADDGVWPAVEDDGSAQYRRIARELAGPEAEAEHDDGLCSRTVLLRPEQPSEHR